MSPRNATYPTSIFPAPVSLNDLGWYWKSRVWKKIRLAALRARDNKCQFCRKPAKHVLHRHYRTLGLETLADLFVMCSDCRRGRGETDLSLRHDPAAEGTTPLQP